MNVISVHLRPVEYFRVQFDVDKYGYSGFTWKIINLMPTLQKKWNQEEEELTHPSRELSQ